MARSQTDLPRMQNQAPQPGAARARPESPSASRCAAEKPQEAAKPQMMRQYELVERVRRYNPNTDEALLNRAYVYAMKAHGEQKRASGDPYFSHPLEVAAILTDLKLDDATIAAALLHDTIEDTDATRAEIDQMFGPDIGALVEGLTKLKKLDLVSKRGQAGREPAQAAAGHRRRRARAAGQARRPAAQHAHARATCRPEARRRIAEETLDIYAPLAGRMGMHEMREELEDLAFRELNPEAYQVDQRAARRRSPTRNSSLIAEIEQQLTKKLADRGIDARGEGARASAPIRSGARWSASRSASSSCPTSSASASSSKTLGRVLPRARHRAHHLADGAGPLQGLHLDAEAERLPLDPHHRDRARASSASSCRSAPTRCTRSPNTASPRTRSTRTAHGSPTEMLSRESSAYAWLRRTIELLAEGSNPEEFLEHTKLELFHDQVFCFTPKGKLIALPRKATPIDFAYAVHTDVGNTRGRLQDQRQDRAAGLRTASTATRSRSSPRRRRPRRRRPGNRSSSPARRAPRSAAPRASPCARNMPASAGASSSGCSSAPRRDYSDEKLHGRAAAAGARLDRGGDGGGRPRRDAAVRRRARDVSRLQGGARRARCRRRSRKAAGSA